MARTLLSAALTSAFGTGLARYSRSFSSVRSLTSPPFCSKVCSSMISLVAVLLLGHFENETENGGAALGLAVVLGQTQTNPVGRDDVIDRELTGDVRIVLDEVTLRFADLERGHDEALLDAEVLQLFRACFDQGLDGDAGAGQVLRLAGKIQVIGAGLVLDHVESDRLVGRYRDLEAVQIARRFGRFLRIDKVPAAANAMFEDHRAFLLGPVLDRVGTGLAHPVMGGEIVRTDLEVHVGAGRGLDVGLDFDGLIEGVAQKTFLAGVQVEDARIAGVRIVLVDGDGALVERLAGRILQRRPRSGNLAWVDGL